MVNCRLLTLTEQHNTELLSILLASPIHANGLELCFDKSPDIFSIARMKYDNNIHLGMFIDDKLKGFASLGYYKAMVGGRVEPVFSFYHFYLVPEARGNKLSVLAMKEFFRHVAGSKANYGIAITLRGNRPTESYIGDPAAEGLPPSRVIDTLVVKTILFSRRKKNTTTYTVRNATVADTPAIVDLLKEEYAQRDFGRIVSEETFLPELERQGLRIENYFVAIDRTGRLKGVCLAWDCNQFRRTRVIRYSTAFYPYLLAYRALAIGLRLAPFPARGEAFNELTITDSAVYDRDPAIMHALLSEIYYQHHNRHYHFMNWGSCGSDPILKAADGFWYKNIVSHIAFSSMDPARQGLETKLPYVDIAFL
jgi:hypothetical protein